MNIKRFIANEEGQSMVEYSVLFGSLSGIAYIVSDSLTNFTTDLFTGFNFWKKP